MGIGFAQASVFKGADDAFDVDGFGGAIHRAFGKEVCAVSVGRGLGLFFVEPPEPTARRRIPVVGNEDGWGALGIQKKRIVVKTNTDAMGGAVESAFLHREGDDPLGIGAACPQSLPCAFCGFLIAAFEGDFCAFEGGSGFERGDGKDDLLAFFDGGQGEIGDLDGDVISLFGAVEGTESDKELIGQMRIGLGPSKGRKRSRKICGQIKAEVVAFAFGIREEGNDLRKARCSEMSDVSFEACVHLVACEVCGR